MRVSHGKYARKINIKYFLQYYWFSILSPGKNVGF